MAHALRGMPQLMPSILTTIARAKGWSESPVGPQRNFSFLLNPSPEQYEAYLATAKGQKIAGVDVETPRDNPHKITICGVSCAPNTAAVVYWEQPYISIFAAAMKDQSVVKSMHNGGFDQIAFLHNGLDMLLPYVDTIQAEAMLRPPFKEVKKRKWLGLSRCMTEHFNGWFNWKRPDDPLTKALYRAAFPEIPEYQWPLMYCGIDAIASRLLWPAQARALMKVGMFDTFIKYVVPAAPVLIKMEYRGIPVDEPRRMELLRELEADIKICQQEIWDFANTYHKRRIAELEESVRSAEELEKHELERHPLFTSSADGTKDSLVRCGQHPDYTGLTRRAKCPSCVSVYRGAGSLRGKIKAIRNQRSRIRSRIKQLGPSFKEGSSDHWRWLLFDPSTLALQPTAFTETKGLPRVKDEDIEALFRLYPNIPILKRRVEIQHALHTKGVLEVPTDYDGHAHFVTSQHRTETMRLASGTDDEEEGKIRLSPGGNLQNKKDHERSIFCAGDPNKVFVEWDWSQIELRVMAWKARATELLRALASGQRIHALNAAAIFGCKPEDAKKFMVPFEGQMRDADHAAKRATHGWDYGMGEVKTGQMYQPCATMTLQEVAQMLVERYKQRRDVISPDTVRKLFRGGAVEHARLYTYANSATARDWIRAYFARWPELAEFQNWVIKEVEQNRSLTNSFGYTLRFWNFQYKDGRWQTSDREEALAMIPQSDVGFMTKVNLPPMDKCFEDHGGELLISNHDAFGGIVEKARLVDFYHASKPIMERPWPQLGELKEFGLFSCPAECMVGWNWGKKHHTQKCYIDNKLVCDSPENPRGLEAYSPEG